MVIASGRIRADTEKAHSERSLRLRGQVQAPRRYPAVGRLIPTGGRLAPAPAGFVPGWELWQKTKTPSEGGRISNRRGILHRLCPCPNERLQGSTWAVEKSLGPRPHPAIKVSSSMPIWPMLRIRRIYQIFDDMMLPRSSEWGVPRLGEKIHTWQRDVKY